MIRSLHSLPPITKQVSPSSVLVQDLSSFPPLIHLSFSLHFLFGRLPPPEQYEMATVLVFDVVGYTKRCARMTAMEVARWMTDLHMTVRSQNLRLKIAACFIVPCERVLTGNGSTSELCRARLRSRRSLPSTLCEKLRRGGTAMQSFAGPASQKETNHSTRSSESSSAQRRLPPPCCCLTKRRSGLGCRMVLSL